jgi:hypothetical protein
LGIKNKKNGSVFRPVGPKYVAPVRATSLWNA